MDKELHIYMYNPENVICLVSYKETEKAIHFNEPVIYTTQIHFCQSRFIYDNGYIIYIHFWNGRVVRIDKNGTNATNRKIKKEHNLEKLLIAGEFGEL